MSARLSTMPVGADTVVRMERWTGDHNASTAGRNGVRTHVRVHTKSGPDRKWPGFPILTPRLAHADVGAHINGIDITGSS